MPGAEGNQQGAFCGLLEGGRGGIWDLNGEGNAGKRDDAAEAGRDGWNRPGGAESGSDENRLPTVSETKASGMEKDGPMPIHGKLLMTLPFRGISETDSVFSFCPPLFHAGSLSSTKRFPHEPCIVWFLRSGSRPGSPPSLRPAFLLVFSGARN